MTDIILIFANAEDVFEYDDQDGEENYVLIDQINDWLHEHAGLAPLERIDEFGGGDIGGSSVIFTGSYPAFAGGGAFARVVLGLDWLFPENVLLIVHDEAAAEPTKVHRPTA